MKLDKEFKPKDILHASEMNEIVEAINSTSVNGVDGLPVEGAEVFNDYTNDLPTEHSNAGIYSSAFNNKTRAEGDYSFSAGSTTSALGESSAAFGKSTVTKNLSEFACGRWNVSHTSSPDTADMPDSTSLFTIGCGTGVDHKNAMAVILDGSVYINGIGNYDGKTLSGAQTLQTIVNNVASYYHVGSKEERVEFTKKHPAPGTAFFDTTDNKVFYWSNNSTWVNADGTQAQ